MKKIKFDHDIVEAAAGFALIAAIVAVWAVLFL